MSDWSPDQVAELTRLWGEGLSGGEIGKRLGISKNSVVGKVHRLHLPSRPSPIKRGVPRKTPAQAAHSPERRREWYARHQNGVVAPRLNRRKEAVAPESTAPVRRRMAAVDLLVGNQQCKWPIGHPDEADFHFCTDKAVVGKPYCQDHYEQSVVRAKPGEAL